MIEISVNAGSPQAAAVFADAIGQQTSLYANQLYPAYNLEILDAAVLPKTRTSPNLSLNYSLGAFLGLFIGISAAFLSVALQPARTPQPQLPQRKPGVNPGPARGVTDSSTLVRRYNQPSKD